MSARSREKRENRGGIKEREKEGQILKNVQVEVNRDVVECERSLASLSLVGSGSGPSEYLESVSCNLSARATSAGKMLE